MNKLKINKKIIITTLTTVIVGLVVAIPLGVVLGDKGKTYENKVSSDFISIEYGTKLEDTAKFAKRIDGYKDPIVVENETTYIASAVVGTTNLKATFLYELNGTKSDISPLHFVYPVNIVKAKIVQADVLESSKSANGTIGYGINPQTIATPTVLAKYNLWTGPTSYTTDSDTPTVLQLDDILKLEVGQKFRALYTATPDSNHEAEDADLKVVTLTKTFTITKANAIIPETKAIKDFFYGSVFPAVNDLPILKSYQPWNAPVLKNNGVVVNINEIKVGDTFTATFSANLDETHYVGASSINHEITYFVKKGEAATFTQTTGTENYVFSENELPKSGAPAMVKGYLPWNAPTYSLQLSEIVKLNVGQKFTATYKTALDSQNYNGTVNNIEKVITFTVIKANAPKYVDENTKADFNFETNILPTAGAPTQQALGYDLWSTSAKYTSLNGDTQYANGAALALLNAGTQFIATYEATINSNYTSSETTIKKVVTFTVQPIPAAIFTETTQSLDYIFDEQLPTPAKPARVNGYSDWSDAVSSPATILQIRALNVGDTFTLTFEANRDSNHTGLQRITKVITYTVKAATPDTFTDTTENQNYVFNSLTTLPLITKPAIVRGYNDWSNAVFNPATISEVNALTIGQTFTATFEATLKNNYSSTITKITKVVTLKVVSQAAATFVDTSPTTANYVFDSAIPTPSKPARVQGYSEWSEVVFSPLNIATLVVDQTFTGTFTATLLANYTGVPTITKTITYTVRKATADLLSDPTESRDFIFGQQIPTTKPPIVKGYNQWSDAVVNPVNASTLPVGQTFSVTFTASLNTNYLGFSTIIKVINYTIRAG